MIFRFAYSSEFLPNLDWVWYGQVRRDNPMDASTVKLFLRGLNSDILPMRQVRLGKYDYLGPYHLFRHSDTDLADRCAALSFRLSSSAPVPRVVMRWRSTARVGMLK